MVKELECLQKFGEKTVWKIAIWKMEKEMRGYLVIDGS
jgi:hypothetical protein